LKRIGGAISRIVASIFILLSIKTRIETPFNTKLLPLWSIIFILLSIKTRIETFR